MGKRKFGRSGAFRRKRSALVGKIFTKYKPSNTQKNVEQSENDAVFLNDTNIECQLTPETDDSVIMSEAESAVIINIENSHENNKEKRDFQFDHIRFQSALASWTVNNGIKHDHLRGLLHIWNEYVPLPVLPVDPRTILDTPRIVTIKENYWHRGLKVALQKILSKSLNIPDIISLKINADGITILESSGVECWPILVEIAEIPKISPEIVGVYCGQGKPKNLESYLRDFVDEFKDCLSNGLIYNRRVLMVKLKCFICDYPARAALKSRFYICTYIIYLQ